MSMEPIWSGFYLSMGVSNYRLINRYNDFPGEIEIKEDIEKTLKFWKITKDNLFEKTNKLWSNNFRPSNTNKDLVGSGFDTSN